MTNPTETNSDSLEEIRIPSRGEYQTIIDSHSFCCDIGNSGPRRGIIRANEQPYSLPFSVTRGNERRITVSPAYRSALYASILEDEEYKIPSDQYYGICMFFIIFLLIIAASTHFELAKFIFIWICACGVFICAIYGMKTFVSAVYAGYPLQTSEDDNYHHIYSFPFGRRRCPRDPPDDDVYFGELPTYDLSLTCPVAMFETPLDGQPSPPPKYHVTAPSELSSGSNTPPPPYDENETLAERDRNMEEHRQELEAEFRLHFENDSSNPAPASTITYENEHEDDSVDNDNR